MLVRRVWVSWLLIAACGGSSVDDAPEPEEVLFGTVQQRERSPVVDGGDFTAVVTAERRLALGLYRVLREAKPDENLAVGAYSVNQVLGMLYAGARGVTADEMEHALGWDLPPERLHTALNKLDLEIAKRREDVTLDMANRVWAQRGFPVLPAFLDVLTRDYGAPLAITDFAANGEAARAEVNDWVRRVTRDHIPELFPEGTIDQQTLMVLANAMYLDAPWKYKLDPGLTSAQPFRLADGTQVSVETMHYNEFLPSAVSADWKAVELPYRGDELSMVVIVPKDLAAFERSLTPESLDAILHAIDDGGIHLSLPKLSISAHASLVDALSALGMPSLFDGADLSGIAASGDLSVGALEHEVSFDVDETGAKAAAATGGSIPGSHGPTIEVNRPFLFLLLDRPTGAFLFIGRVVDPRG